MIGTRKTRRKNGVRTIAGRKTQMRKGCSSCHWQNLSMIRNATSCSFEFWLYYGWDSWLGRWLKSLTTSLSIQLLCNICFRWTSIGTVRPRDSSQASMNHVVWRIIDLGAKTDVILSMTGNLPFWSLCRCLPRVSVSYKISKSEDCRFTNLCRTVAFVIEVAEWLPPDLCFVCELSSQDGIATNIW